MTDRGNVVQTPLAYHPKTLLYDIACFGGLPQFKHACVENYFDVEISKSGLEWSFFYILT